MVAKQYITQYTTIVEASLSQFFCRLSTQYPLEDVLHYFVLDYVQIFSLWRFSFGEITCTRKFFFTLIHTYGDIRLLVYPQLCNYDHIPYRVALRQLNCLLFPSGTLFRKPYVPMQWAKALDLTRYSGAMHRFEPVAVVKTNAFGIGLMNQQMNLFMHQNRQMNCDPALFYLYLQGDANLVCELPEAVTLV